MSIEGMHTTKEKIWEVDFVDTDNDGKSINSYLVKADNAKGAISKALYEFVKANDPADKNHIDINFTRITVFEKKVVD